MTNTQHPENAETRETRENPFAYTSEASGLNESEAQACGIEASAPEGGEAASEEGPTREELVAMNEELHQQYLRLAADFENFRKRRLQEMEYQRKYGAEQFLSNFLPVLDNFDRAHKAINPESEPKDIFNTLQMMQQQLKQALEESGLKRYESLDKPFDPNYHEAVSRLSVPGKEENTVIAEQQAGYMLHDKVLRVAQVVVAAGDENA